MSCSDTEGITTLKLVTVGAFSRDTHHVWDKQGKYKTGNETVVKKSGNFSYTFLWEPWYCSLSSDYPSLIMLVTTVFSSFDIHSLQCPLEWPCHIRYSRPHDTLHLPVFPVFILWTCIKLKELTWMTRNKSRRCGRYRTYKGTKRNFRANRTYRT